MDTEKSVKVNTSTSNKRNKKAERRKAKAEHKAAGRIEEKKSRPNNVLLAVLIFGLLIGMFAFVKGHEFFTKPATLEKFMKDAGYTEMYTDMPISEYTTMTVRADGNQLKVLLKVTEEAPKEEIEQFQGKDGKDNLRSMGAYLLESIKPETRALSGSVKIGVKQGDKTINYVKMSHRQAKKFLKEEEKKAAEEADSADETTDK